MLQSPKIYFPGLNALRFFAAFAVIICHMELIQHGMDLPSFYMRSVFIRELGSLGVYFFFVLSGFLITYLLLQEQQKQGTVSVKKFYMRRVLRIWPLYLFIIILGFFILPVFFSGMTIGYLDLNFKKYYVPDLVLYLVMLPNVAFAFFTAVPHIGHLWSIGIEEQFYLTWPWLFKKRENLFRKLFLLLGLIILAKTAFILYYKTQEPSFFLEGLKNLIAMSKFENMVIGGMGALILFDNKQSYLKWLRRDLVFYLSLLAVPVLVCLPLGFLQDGIHIVYSILFLIIILNVISRTRQESFLEGRLMVHLGNISYGLYMYHMIVIALVVYFVKTVMPAPLAVPAAVIIYPVSVILTILTAHCSYTYFESYFLKLKNKFNW